MALMIMMLAELADKPDFWEPRRSLRSQGRRYPKEGWVKFSKQHGLVVCRLASGPTGARPMRPAVSGCATRRRQPLVDTADMVEVHTLIIFRG